MRRVFCWYSPPGGREAEAGDPLFRRPGRDQRLRCKVTLREVVPKVAVSVAFVLRRMLRPAVTLNFADVEPAAMATEEGVVRDELLSDNETVTPPLAAAEVRVTVQTLVAPEFRLVGEQASAERVAGGVRLRTAVLDMPFRVALTVTL